MISPYINEKPAECWFFLCDPPGSPLVEHLAGAAGFEPANAGTKNRCLTTWRRPKINSAFDSDCMH